jgi:hypothetical protein
MTPVFMISELTQESNKLRDIDGVITPERVVGSVGTAASSAEVERPTVR